jgi:hypothetical protein
LEFWVSLYLRSSRPREELRAVPQEPDDVFALTVLDVFGKHQIRAWPTADGREVALGSIWPMAGLALRRWLVRRAKSAAKLRSRATV